MFFFGGAFGIALLVLWVWAVIDVIITDRARCRNLPKIAWVLLVIFLGVIGALGWILFGRPARSSVRSGDAPRRLPSRPIGPEDRPEWTAAPSTPPVSRERAEELDRRLEEWEAEQRRRRPDEGGTDEPHA